MSLSPHSQIQFYSTRTSEPKTTFIKKSHSTLSKAKKPNSTAQQEPGDEFRITIEGWRHPVDDQEFDEFMDDSYVYRSPPKITTPIRVIPSNSGMRVPMERAYSSLREEVREVKVDPVVVPVEPEKVRTRKRELSLEQRPSVEEPRALSPKELRLKREESRMSRQAENQLKKENREEYRPIPQVEISFKKEDKCEPKMSRQDRKDDPRVLRSVEKSSKQHLMNKDESNSPDRAGEGSSAPRGKEKRAWIVKAIGQEPPQEAKLQIQNLVIQRLDKTTSSVAKSYEKPAWPVRGAIRLDKLIKNEGAAGVKSDKSYALLALNPPKATTIQVNFEKKPSASQLAIFEKFQILHKEAQEKEKEKEKEREKYYLEHNSPNFIPASKQKMSITKLEPTFETPKATIKYVHKIKTASLHSVQNLNLSNSAVELESPSTTPSSKPVTKAPKRRNVASMSLDKTQFESAGALDQLVQAILQENPPAGASWLNKTRVATRKDVACFNDYANRTGDIDVKKTTLTPLSSYKIIAESRTKAGVSPISLTKEASKLQNQNTGYPPKLHSQIEHIWSSIKHSSSSVHSSAKRQSDRFGGDKLGELNQIMTLTRSVVGDKSSSLLDPKIDINEWATIFAPPGRRTGRGRRSGEDLFQRDTPSNLLGKKDLSCPKISHTEQKESL